MPAAHTKRADALRWLGAVAALAALYFATGRLGVGLAHYQENATLIWPPSGLALAALVLYGRRLWPGVFLGAALVNLSLGTPWQAVAGIAVGNTLEALVGAYLLVSVARFRPSFERVRDVVAYIGLGALASALISALIGPTSLDLVGGIDHTQTRFATVVLVWWLGDVGGLIVLGPILLLGLSGTQAWRELGRRPETWIAAAGLVGACALAFGGFTSGPWALIMAFAPFAFLVWVGGRLGALGAVLAAGATATIATVGTSTGVGPFVDESIHATMMLLCAYSLTMGTAGLTLAAAVSEREHAEAERRREVETRLGIERKMNHAQRLESLGLLAGGVAHDFNNILAGIRGNAELARLGLPPDAPAAARLDRIETASDRAADLCRRLLAYAGRRPPAKRAVMLSEIVDETIALIEPSLGRRDLIHSSSSADTTVVDGDPTLLRQVLMNLVLNAAEVIGDGEGRVTVASECVDLDDDALLQMSSAVSARSGRFGLVEVTDSGPGIERETIERMFDPFFTTKFDGRGLGLAAVLGIVNSHAGAIDVQSELGRGTAMRVYLPIASADTAAASAGDDAASAVPVHGGGRLVLLADDEEEVRDVLTAMLTSAGYRVTGAADGVEALRRFEELGGDIDLVVLDVTMPVMGGFATYKEIRSRDADVPILFMTGHAPEDTGTVVDPESIILKPFRSDVFLERVASALAASGRRTGDASPGASTPRG